MANEIRITEKMRNQIGRDLPPWRYEVTTSSVRAFARGVGYTDPVYYDEEAAKAAGYRSLPAPPTYLGTAIFIPGESSGTTSRPFAGEPSIDHGLDGQLDGGTETEYFGPVCAGDTLSVVSRITALEVRDSKALGKMLVMSSESTYVNEETGKRIALQRRQWIFH
ncbi:MAG TPA: MaoC family dehydratase N-terminal domain-containing protein [Gammaproteobacteria bacterium]|nr:MaoC family dehydratase N-terminal domain-containing protein [Gammaproteobacteria bacterium]